MLPNPRKEKCKEGEPKMKVSEVRNLSELIGRKVKTRRTFAELEVGTIGTVTKKYGDKRHSGIMVKWDEQNFSDGFGRDVEFDETCWLELL